MDNSFKNLILSGNEPHVLVENGEFTCARCGDEQRAERPRFVIMPWREFELMRADARERVCFAPTPENGTAPHGFFDSSSLLKHGWTDEQEKGASGRKSIVPFFGAGFAEVADEVLDAPVFVSRRRAFAPIGVDTAKIRLEDLPV